MALHEVNVVPAEAAERIEPVTSRTRSVWDVPLRALDIAVATLALLVLAPLLMMVALAIRLDDGGPAIFRQERSGRGRKPFTVLKFRTMAVNNDESEHRREVLRQLNGGRAKGGAVGFKPRTDPRITRVGRVLRRYSLDELPQLVNVLRGEMSVVGPRPIPVWEADSLPGWAEPRFQVKPGVTGLWQVEGRNQLSMADMLELDVRYARGRSLWKDLSILMRTVPTVLTGRGAA